MPEREFATIVNYLVEKQAFPLVASVKFACEDGRTFALDLDGAQANGLSDDLRTGKISSLTLSVDSGVTILAELSKDLRERLSDELKKTIAKALTKPGVDFQIA